MGRRALALGRDRRVAVGVVEHARRGGAQGVGEVLLDVDLGVVGDPGVDGGLLGRGGRDGVVEAHECRVDGVGRGLAQVDPAVLLVELVLDLVGGARHLVGRGAADAGPRGVAVLQGTHQRVGLERRAGRQVRVHRVVVGTLGEVGAAIQGLDGPRAGLDRGHAGLRTLDVLGGAPVGDRLDHRLLVLLVDRRDDAQAALGDVVLVQLGPGDELLLGQVDQVAVGAAGDLDRLGLGHGRIDGLGPLLRGEPAQLDHRVEDPRDALLAARQVGRRAGGVVDGGPADDRGEQGALGRGQLRDVLAEVGLGRRLDAARASPEVDRVEVVLEDLVLAALLVQLDGDDDLLELALDGLVAGQEGVLDVLLRDGRPALGRTALQRDLDRAGDAARAYAVVGVEGTVLGGEEGLLHVVGDRGQRDVLAVGAAGQPTHLGLAVGEVDGRDLRLRRRVGLGDVDRRVEVGDARGAERQQRDDREAEPDQEASPSAAAATGLAHLARRVAPGADAGSGALGRGWAHAISLRVRGGRSHLRSALQYDEPSWSRPGASPGPGVR